MELFPVLREKMQISIRNKMPEKKAESEKSLQNIRESLNSEIYKYVSSYRSDKFIFSF
jgi:hypothetical protein